MNNSINFVNKKHISFEKVWVDAKSLMKRARSSTSHLEAQFGETSWRLQLVGEDLMNVFLRDAITTSRAGDVRVLQFYSIADRVWSDIGVHRRRVFRVVNTHTASSSTNCDAEEPLA